MNKSYRKSAFPTIIVLLIAVFFIPATTMIGTIPGWNVDDTIPNENLNETGSSEEDRGKTEAPCGCPNRFSSYEELRAYVKDSAEQYRGLLPTPRWGPEGGNAGFGGFRQATILFSTEGSGLDYATTNIQVQGVDEPDIVKTDGQNLYVVSDAHVVIVRAYPGGDARVLSRIETEDGIKEIFLGRSRLVLFENSRWTETSVTIYDISSKLSPRLIDRTLLSGHYIDSRLIGDYLYLITSQDLSYDLDDNVRPAITRRGITRGVDASEICYFNEPAPHYSFTLVASINIQNGDLNYEVYLTDTAYKLYVSRENIYITSNVYRRWDEPFEGNQSETTAIHRISIEEGMIEYAAKGAVPGRVLNQFSMDEHRGHFRIATTEGQVSRMNPTARNNVYILDGELNVVGRLENLAPGERIYSARFAGNRCYLVTFRKVDPFFVIDLSNVTRPRVLGELKIPGFSNYLHPYDENHIIGIGKETVEAEEGDFSWFQGVKLSLFDITDMNSPTEISKYLIGDRGTSSEALRDHRAFLFSRSKNLLIIPILLAEIDESKYPDGAPPNAYGDYVWNGAYVFSITLREGFKLRGRISHVDGSLGEYRYYYSPYSVRRSLYIEENIYTISESLIKINQMDNLKEIKKLEL